MKCISAWFDRHMKTRIALQLVLDGLPLVIFLCVVVVGILELNDPLLFLGWLDTIAIGCMYVVMYGGVAILFVFGIWLRSRAKTEFECYPRCKVVSVGLRIFSFIPAILSLGCLVGIGVLYFRNL